MLQSLFQPPWLVHWIIKPTYLTILCDGPKGEHHSSKLHLSCLRVFYQNFKRVLFNVEPNPTTTSLQKALGYSYHHSFPILRLVLHGPHTCASLSPTGWLFFNYSTNPKQTNQSQQPTECKVLAQPGQHTAAMNSEWVSEWKWKRFPKDGISILPHISPSK